MIPPVRILLVDDHAIVRDLLGSRLTREPGFAVVGSVPTADQAVQVAAAIDVDVVLMDIDMSGMSCFDAAVRITEIRPAAKIIFLSAHYQDHHIDQALAVKAHGYVTKGESPEQVIMAIREALNGGAYFSDEVRSRIVVDAAGAVLPQAPRSRLATLTRREREVLRCLAGGLSPKDIAQQDHRSTKTVANHIFSIMNKLNMHSQIELVLFAIREGLVEV
jgi:DNA-binding NarL/FixJ family response regulator